MLDNQSLLNDKRIADIHNFEEQFFKENNLHITFNEEAIHALIKQSIMQDKPIPSLCAELFKDLAYGLKIVARNAQKDTFVLDKDFIENVQNTLSQWIVNSFNSENKS